MSLTRAFLKGMGLTEEQVSAIIEEHTNVTTALKDQVKQYKADADKLPGVQQELETLKADVRDNDWKGKYDKEHGEFERFKSDMATREHLEKVKAAYRKLLSECKVGDKFIDSIMRVTDLSSMKLAEDGSLEGVDALKENIGSAWSGFISTKETKGADVDHPPGDGGDPDSKKTGRAAQIAARYHESLYGKAKKED